MKKHAKKSLLIPILALFAVVAVVAGIYMSQAFSAYADGDTGDEAQKLESTHNGKSIAKIHLSTGDAFRGFLFDGESGQNFFAMFGEKTITYDEEVEGFNFEAVPGKEDPDRYTDVRIVALDSMYDPILPDCFITLDNAFCQFSTGFYNVNTFDGSIDVTIDVNPAYYLCFNANGGEFDGGSSMQWVAQGEYNYIKFPNEYPVWESNAKVFSGWYTHPLWGERITGDYQVPAWGEQPFMIYAHWADPTEAVSINFSSANFGQMFKWELGEIGFISEDNSENKREPWKIIDSGVSSYFSFDASKYELDSSPTVYNSQCAYTRFNGRIPVMADSADTIKEIGDYSFMVLWRSRALPKESNASEVAVHLGYAIRIYALDNQRLDSVSLNGSQLSLLNYGEGPDMNTLRLSQFNNFEIGTSWNVPGYIGISSDNGRLFKCRIDSINDGVKHEEFVSDYVPIFVDKDEYVFYMYGGTRTISDLTTRLTGENYLLEGVDEGYYASTGVPFRIMITNLRDNTNFRLYTFFDNRLSFFDLAEWNSYILGVNIDGEDVPSGNYVNYLPNSLHSIQFKMSDRDVSTSVTYNANGGKFADGSDTVTLDAVYGEGLPSTETPKAAGMDFDGWYTGPVGGFKVDPADYHWMPWDRWNGVTLYAHWVEAPVPPVPPEPVPPEPGPTPEPVNPDVPGGGGAQTGDSMPLVPIAVIAIVAALGCGLAIRKEYF